MMTASKANIRKPSPYGVNWRSNGVDRDGCVFLGMSVPIRHTDVSISSNGEHGLMSLSVRNDSQPQIRAPDPCADESDVRLLQRFVKSRCDLAFAKLVERHEAPVMGVCRRVLADAQDAEDAFQATFMVLASKAASLRSATSLPAWLHKTAFRIALRARANRHRRREQSLEAGTMLADHSAFQQITADHDRSALDEELNRLPESLRSPLFLCCVEGKSRDEAARLLGWSLGSLKGRLERGRRLLRQRLTLRGVTLSTAFVLWLRTQETAQAALNPSLVASTVKACTQFAAGKPVMGYISRNALNLTNGSSSIMTIGFAKTVACSFALIGVLSAANMYQTSSSAAGLDDDGVLAVSPVYANQDGLNFIALAGDAQDKPPGDRPREGDRQREGERPRSDDRRQRDGDAPRRAAERDRPRERGSDFQPQNDRERMLFGMIMQLRREVEEIKRMLQSRDGDRPRGARLRPAAPRADRPRGDAPRADRPRGDRERPTNVEGRPPRERERDETRRESREGERDNPNPREREASRDRQE